MPCATKPTAPIETSVSTGNMVVSDYTSANLVFDYPDADLILRSCDSHDFRVPKLYITNSSPELGRHIQNTLNSSHAPHVEGSLPVVHLSDAGAILDSLLTFIFPLSPILPSTIEETMELLSVAQKYEMKSALIHIRASIARHHPRFTSPDTALQVYSLAQKYGLRREALRAAARIILNFPMTLQDLEDKLDIISGAALYELWRYHKRVRTILTADLKEFRESGACGTLTGLRCTEFSPSLIPRWLDSYIESIGETPKLFHIVKFDVTLARHIRDKDKDRRCACACITSQTIRTFWTALTAAVHGSMVKVNITG
jgi:hypothetical protein